VAAATTTAWPPDPSAAGPSGFPGFSRGRECGVPLLERAAFLASLAQDADEVRAAAAARSGALPTTLAVVLVAPFPIEPALPGAGA
jgi:hypothetical protein